MQAYISYMYLNIYIWCIYIYIYIHTYLLQLSTIQYTFLAFIYAYIIYYVKCFLDITGGAAAADETVKGIVDQIGPMFSPGKDEDIGDSLRFTEIHWDSLRFIGIH